MLNLLMHVPSFVREFYDKFRHLPAFLVFCRRYALPTQSNIATFFFTPTIKPRPALSSTASNLDSGS